MSKKKKSRKINLKRISEKLTIVLTFAFLVFLVVSFVNPVIGSDEKREVCQPEGFSFGEDEERYCVKFIFDNKFLGSDSQVEIVRESDKNDIVYNSAFFFISENEEDAIVGLSVNWLEEGIEFEYDGQRTLIGIGEL